jgi:hypothetical protein
MEIPKDRVIEFLKARGDEERADQARAELPERLDTDQDAGLLATYGVDVDDVKGPAIGGVGPGGMETDG